MLDSYTIILERLGLIQNFHFVIQQFTILQLWLGADHGNRVNAMRGAICETFPEPNRRLLQR